MTGTSAEHVRVIVDALGTDPAHWTPALQARARMSFLALGELPGGRGELEDALLDAARDTTRPRWSRMACAAIVEELLAHDEARLRGRGSVRALRAALAPSTRSTCVRARTGAPAGASEPPEPSAA